MANLEHLEILRQGVEMWNEWRLNASMDNVFSEYDPPDLSGADLHGINLSEVDLSSVDLKNANLTDVILNDAGLIGADLSDARLCNSHLSFVDFTQATLVGADLTGAFFLQTILQETVLANANLLNARMYYTSFNNVDLSEVQNLDSVIHEGPSTIGIDTIYKSGGNISEKFLRGCGVPEDFVIYMRSLTGKAIEFYSCFISYSSKDAEFAKRLYNDLQSEGVRCWFALEDLKIGERLRVRIDEAVRLHDKLLLILSKNSVASQWVEKEVETAFEKEAKQKKTVLFPVRLDDAVMKKKMGWAADVRKSRHIGDFTDWKNHDSYKKAFERLMRDLKAEEKR
ncbi:MAG TPA: toll/interleukin-1 receptor domain-containing protein [Pyrinomonadaceae bacterium]|jgi:hypothetical protein|nr:toll/interleukin-1 receptor domain-containing protein [Pyrinomonadaceae bacterium]